MIAKTILIKMLILILFINALSYCAWGKYGIHLPNDSNSNTKLNGLTKIDNLITNCDLIQLQKKVNHGHSLTVIGNCMFFGGIGLQSLGYLSLSSKSSLGFGAITFLLGSAAIIPAPFISYIGGDITKKGMRLCYPNYENHTGWTDFAISSSLLLIDLIVIKIGSFQSESPNKTFFNTINIIAVGIGITSSVFYIKSIISPLLYSNKAKKDAAKTIIK